MLAVFPNCITGMTSLHPLAPSSVSTSWCRRVPHFHTPPLEQGSARDLGKLQSENSIGRILQATEQAAGAQTVWSCPVLNAYHGLI